MSIIHEIKESDHREDLAPKRKRGRLKSVTEPALGMSSHAQAWNPELLFGTSLISVKDTILENAKIEISTKVTHGLSQAACLLEDMRCGTQCIPGKSFAIFPVALCL